MEKQSEAHRLADTPFALRDGRWNLQADDELLRLHAENERLRIELQVAQGNEQTLAFALLAARRNI